MAKIVGGTTSTPLRQVFVTNSNGEVETITVGNKTYDGFVDYTARGEIEDLKENGTGISVTDDGEGNVVVTSAGGAGGGDCNVLFVSFNEGTWRSTHTATEIEEHVKNGGTAVLSISGALLSLVGCYHNFNDSGELVALFSAVLTLNDEMAICTAAINVNGGCQAKTFTPASKEDFDKAMETAVQQLVSAIEDWVVEVEEATESAQINASEAKDTANAALETANTAKTSASKANTTANSAKSSAEAAELKALQAQNAVTELNTAMSAVQEWQGVVENMAAELSNGVSNAEAAANEAMETATSANNAVGSIGAVAYGVKDQVQLGVLPRLDTIEGYVGDLDAALDAIIAIQKELIGVTLITFTIDGVAFNAEEGMNWVEWCASEYNTDGWRTAGVDNYVIRYRDHWYLMHSDGKVQVGGDVAIDGATYVLD